MKSKKSFIFFLCLFLLTACAQKDNKQIVGKWKYERMEVADLKTSGDTLAQVLALFVYEDSFLEFYANDSFQMTNLDTASEFQGKGTYVYDAAGKTLMMQNLKQTDAEGRMKVAVKELTDDSLKLGNIKELIIYSRVKD